MRSGTIWPGLPGSIVEASTPRTYGILVPVLAEERLGARHAIAQPLPSGVSEGTSTLRVDPDSLSELQVDLRQAPYGLTDLLSHGAQPVLKAVMFVHAQMLAGDGPWQGGTKLKSAPRPSDHDRSAS
jgi:hypothetical protein